MPFIRIPGLKGMIYVPEASGKTKKKQDCNDCFSCQMCADSRCSVCLEEKKHPCNCTPDNKPESQ